MITLCALIGAGLIGWWCKNNVTIKPKGLTPDGWKPDPVFTGLHILVNTTEITAVYRWFISLFKRSKV